MTDVKQDVFLSHASADKKKYIEPLAASLTERNVTYWLDSEIGWGDNVVHGINKGLRESRYAVLCLSANYLGRPWPEAEMSGLLGLQNRGGRKRVLPLILNSREQVLEHYPLLAGLNFLEFSAGTTVIAEAVAAMVGTTREPAASLHVKIESVHTGHISHLLVLPTQSLKWLATKARAGLALSEEADAGGFEPFRVRWVLVDERAEQRWLKMRRAQQRKARAVIHSSRRLIVCEDEYARLGSLELKDGMTFHLYPIEDEDYPPRPGK